MPTGGIPSISVDGEKIAVSYSGDNGSIQVGYGLTFANLTNYNDSLGIDWIYQKFSILTHHFVSIHIQLHKAIIPIF